MTGVAVGNGVTLNGNAGVDPAAAELAALIAPARTTWAAAGGAAPGLASIDPFSLFTESDPNLGTAPSQFSSWQQIGQECFATAKIAFGTGATPGVGWYVLTGLPAVPRQGIVTDARVIGHGFVLDASDTYHRYTVDVVIDQIFDATRPVIWLHTLPADVLDVAELNSAPATGVVSTDVPEVFETIPGVGAAYATGGAGSMFVGAAAPMAWADEDILNVTLQFEAV